MELKTIEHDFSVCKLNDAADAAGGAFSFLSVTDEEISLVCPSKDVPQSALLRDDGWNAFRIQGVLDFSLIGILAEISGILAERKIGIFAVSTYNTDYIFVKRERFADALRALVEAGHTVVSE